MPLYQPDTIIDDAKMQATAPSVRQEVKPMTSFTTLETPALLLDKGILSRNIKNMAQRLSAFGVQLRPHLKTCKSLDVAERIVPPGPAAPITVSTLAEAEYFLNGGYTDILYAVSIVPSKLQHVAALQDKGAKITLILDTCVAATAMAEAAEKLQADFQCLIEIDCDGKRAGLKPDDPEILRIAEILHSAPRVQLSGVMTHAGGSYYCKTTDELTRFAEQERTAITSAAAYLRNHGHACTIVSMGSTPTVTFAQNLEGVTEVRAGVYVFQDMVMQALGVCTCEDIAISVLATVISHNPAHNRILIDAGSLALSADPGAPNHLGKSHFGQVCTADTGQVIPGLFVTSSNQEHGLLSLDDTSYNLSDFPIGSQLRILPNHACITAAAYPAYQVIDGSDTILDVWGRCNGWSS